MVTILNILGRPVQSNAVFFFLVQSFPCSAEYFSAQQNIFFLMQKSAFLVGATTYQILLYHLEVHYSY